MFVRDNLPRAHDVKWIAKFGGMLDKKGGHVPSGRFNAGEKALFWGLVVVISITLVVTGYILNFPNFGQTRSTMQTANVIHMVFGLLGIAMACFHIYLGTSACAAPTRRCAPGTWTRPGPRSTTSTGTTR